WSPLPCPPIVSSIRTLRSLCGRTAPPSSVPAKLTGPSVSARKGGARGGLGSGGAGAARSGGLGPPPMATVRARRTAAMRRRFMVSPSAVRWALRCARGEVPAVRASDRKSEVKSAASRFTRCLRRAVLDCVTWSDAMNAAVPRILVVEDELAIQRGLCDVLVYRGYAPTGVADGDAGLREALGGAY